MILKKDEMRAKFNSLSEHNHISVNKPKVQHEKAATFLDILKSFSVCQEMLPLFRAVLKFCSTNRLFKPKVLRRAALRQSWFSWGPPLKRYKLICNLIKYSCTIHFSYDYNSLMFAERKRKERYRN